MTEEAKPEKMNKLDSKIVEQLEKLSDSEKKSILKQLGHQKLTAKEYKFDLGQKHIKVGILSDSHYGNKNHDYFLESKLFKVFRRESVDFVWDIGDMLDGHDMHYGQFWEQSDSTYDGQLKDFIENRPYIQGKKQYLLSGNHMYNGFDKKIGFNSGKNLAEQRDDLEWLADQEADIILTPKFKVKILHPGDGITAYALSYKLQKKYEGLGKNAPEMFIVGHYHKSGLFQYMGGQLLLPGTTEQQTSFMRSKGINCSPGGWVVDLYFKDNNELSRLKAEFIEK